MNNPSMNERMGSLSLSLSPSLSLSLVFAYSVKMIYRWKFSTSDKSFMYIIAVLIFTIKSVYHNLSFYLCFE